MSRPFWILAGASVSFGQISCGSGAPTIPDELLACDCQENGSYPIGPYGSELGDTIENFSFMGYLDPRQDRTLEQIQFSDFYDPDGSKGVQLLLLNTAAAWCQPCQIEHLDLPQRVDAHQGQGLAVVSMLFQDRNGDAPTEETLRSWTTTFDTNFPMALDPGFQMGRYGPGDTPPLNLIIDPRSMKILAIFVGNQEEPMWAFIDRELAAKNGN